MKIELPGIKSGTDRTYTIEIPPGVPAVDATCSAQAAYKRKPCGLRANHHMTNGKHHVQVCGNHAKTLRARGWSIVPDRQQNDE